MNRRFVISLCFVQSILAEPVIISEENNEELEITKMSEEELLQRVFGTNRQQKDVTMTFTVTLDGEKVGNAVVIVGQNERKIFAQTLKEMLSPYLLESEVKRINKVVDKDGFVSFKKLSFLNLKTDFNLTNLDVAITVPLEKKKARSLNPRAEKHQAKITVQPALISGMLNTRISQSTTNHASSSDRHTDISIAPSLNVAGVVLEGAGTFSNVSGTSEKKFKRDYAALVYDFPYDLMSIRAGDVFGASQSYCSVPRMWGVSFRKEAPTSSSTNFNQNLQLTVLRQSKIEVFVNNVLVRTKDKVAPGTYFLDDIPYTYGNNDVKIKITDDTGKVTEIDAGGFLDSSLITPGEFSLDLAAGYPENNSSTEGRYDKKNTTISGNIRVGLPMAMDVAVGGTKAKHGNTAVIELRHGNILGNFSAKFARSKHKANLKGRAQSFSYSTHSINLFDITSISGGISYEKTDDFFYSYLNESSDSTVDYDNTLLHQNRNYNGKNSTISYHFGVSNLLGMTLSVNHEIRRRQTEPNEKRSSFSLSRGFSFDGTVFNSMSLYFSYDKTRTENQKSSRSFSLGCSLSLRTGHSVSSGYSKHDDNSSQYVSLSGDCLNNSLYYSARNEHQQGSNSVSGNLNYYHTKFSADLAHTRGNDSSNSTQIGFETNLFFADGSFGVSRNRPYDGGFVIVTPGKGLENYPIKMANSEIESGLLGGAVITSGHHSISTSEIDIQSMPDNIEIKETSVTSYGEYKRGAVKEVSVEGTYLGKGRLFDKKGAPFDFAAGYAVNVADKTLEPIVFFTNKTGDFILPNLKLGKYRITINVEGCDDFEVNIQPTPNNIVDLGDITCEGTYDQDN